MKESTRDPEGRAGDSPLRLRDAGVSWRRVDDEVVVLDSEASRYFAVNESGAVLWERLADGTTREELVSALLESFDLDRTTAHADVEQFLVELRSSGMLDEG